MRRALLIALLALSGCASWFETDSESELTDRPEPVDAYGDKADLVMSRAAASVSVAREANKGGRPDIVEAELGVAATYLPRPTESDLAYAKSRAGNGNKEAYDKARVVADKHQRDLDAAWGAVEAEKQKAKDQLEKARLEQERQIAAKEAELAAEREFWRDMLITGAGGIIILASVAGWFWGEAVGVSKPEAGVGLLVGSGVAVLPHVMSSEYAEYSIAGAGALGLIKLVQVMFMRRQ